MEEKSLDLYNVATLIAKSLSAELSLKETEELEEWLKKHPYDVKLVERLHDQGLLEADLQSFCSGDLSTAWDLLHTKLQQDGKRKDEYDTLKQKTKVYAYSVAAVLCFIAFTAIWVFPPHYSRRIVSDLSGEFRNDILPGKNQAQLVLSNGQIIDLSDRREKLSEQDGSAIHAADGNIRYDLREGQTDRTPIFNTLRVPKGGTFQLTLSDGTKIWLNSNSTLRFPIRFADSERAVFLKGEAFFEVVGSDKKSFIVHIDDKQVQVLGTRFNINTYHQKFQTVLEQGSVKLISPTGTSAILRPGQMGNIAGAEIKVGQANLRKTLAWMHNEFFFQQDKLSAVAEQLARWYDIELDVDPSLAETSISGSIARDVRLSETLKMIKYITQAQIDINGKSVSIRPSNK